MSSFWPKIVKMKTSSAVIDKKKIHFSEWLPSLLIYQSVCIIIGLGTGLMLVCLSSSHYESLPLDLWNELWCIFKLLIYPLKKVNLMLSIAISWLLIGQAVSLHFQIDLSGIRSQQYSEVIMGMMASQITSLMIVYSTIYSDADQRKHQSSEPLAFVWGIHQGLVNSPHKWPVTWKMFPFDDIIMTTVIMVVILNSLSPGNGALI